MNLLLVEPAELAADGTCVLADRRARYLRDVHGVRVGSVVRAGVIGGGIGTAEVIADDGARVTLALVLGAATAPARDVELVVAVPRPKAIARAIEIAASFGVARVELTNAWRVDKSYLASPKLAADALATAARVGAEQGMTTRVPDVRVWPLFVALVDARFARGDTQETRLVAHPGAPPIERAALGDGRTVIAIGPERGWIDRELDTLVARGFQAVSLGAPVLRVEAAIVAALAELALLHRIR